VPYPKGYVVWFRQNAMGLALLVDDFFRRQGDASNVISFCETKET
jgi:hypothetical protein